MTVAAVVLLFTMACDTISGPLPAAPTPLSRMVTDAGFPIRPRRPCTEIVRAALADPDPGGIARVADQAFDFTCGESEDAPPLDRAVLSGSVERVRALVAVAAAPAHDPGTSLAMSVVASPRVSVYPLIVRTGIRCARKLWRLVPTPIRVRFQPRIGAVRTRLRTLLGS